MSVESTLFKVQVLNKPIIIDETPSKLLNGDTECSLNLSALLADDTFDTFLSNLEIV